MDAAGAARPALVELLVSGGPVVLEEVAACVRPLREQLAQLADVEPHAVPTGVAVSVCMLSGCNAPSETLEAIARCAGLGRLVRTLVVLGAPIAATAIAANLDAPGSVGFGDRELAAILRLLRHARRDLGHAVLCTRLLPVAVDAVCYAAAHATLLPGTKRHATVCGTSGLRVCLTRDPSKPLEFIHYTQRKKTGQASSCLLPLPEPYSDTQAAEATRIAESLDPNVVYVCAVGALFTRADTLPATRADALALAVCVGATQPLHPNTTQMYTDHGYFAGTCYAAWGLRGRTL